MSAQVAADRFTGDWLVTEYVYNPDGTFAGEIQQRRKLQRRDDGTTRVVQQCTPDVRLAEHIMAAFAGEWVFDLTREGRTRRYHGPDVVGMGLAWGESCITGRGVWTRFGHNFTSFGVMVLPHRQITGGKFYNANELVANIFGVAVPETQDAPNDFPRLGDAVWSGDVAPCWQGEQSIFDDAGVKTSASVQRVYRTNEWTDTVQVDGMELTMTTRLEPMDQRLRVERIVNANGQTGGYGIAKRSGPLLDLHLHTADDHSVHTEIIDSLGGNLVVLDQSWSQNIYCVRTAVVVMTAENNIQEKDYGRNNPN